MAMRRGLSRGAVWWARLELAHHGTLRAGGAVPEPDDLDPAVRLLLDRLTPGFEDLAPRACRRCEGGNLERRLGRIGVSQPSRAHHCESGGERRGGHLAE